MDGKDKTLRKRNLYTKEQMMDFFTNITLPDGMISNYIEKDNYIEFVYEDTIYSALIDGGNWTEIKEEMFRQKERKLKESYRMKELEKQDSLTRLFNKEYTRQIIDEFLAASKPDSKHALMIVDIDNFQVVNENLGYLFGDTVLINIADSLRKIFYDTDIPGRIGGDEFLIFLKNVDNQEVLKDKAEEIYSVFRNTYTGENTNYSMSCSIGIGVYPDDGADFEQLFSKADAALIYTRENQKNYYGFYREIENSSSYIDTGCYEKYKITKTRAYGSNNFDKEITAFAFDIMSRTKDVNSAINLLLTKVRAQFDCSHICILENSINSQLITTYLSCKDEIKPDKSKFNNFVLELNDNTSRFDENGIFFINNVTAWNEEYEIDILKTMHIQALLQCGIFENGVLKGCVSIHDNEKPRYWTQYEIDSMVTITKIISSYLLKMRASERANEQLYKIKNYDALTGLPSLHKFKKDVRKLLADNPRQKYVIIYSDITQFKYINDTLGYDVGDRILSDFAMLISCNGTKMDGVARISEDNFLAACPLIDEKVLKDNILLLNEQFNIKQRSKYPGNKFIIASGVSVIDPAEDISVAIDNANVARKSIKNSSKTDCKFFDNSMKVKLQREAEITNSMEQALKNSEFIVYLQPKIGLTDNNLVGAEALVRWKKNENTLIPPNDFIPLFERNGFVVNLDFYIYEEVCKLLHYWINNNLPVVPISVNVSRIHLNDENFVNEIKKLVDHYAIPYHLLELELTESIFLNNAEAALTTMKKLRKLGFGVSIDDFGAGYSSLNLLKNMETDVIKLDKEFFGKGDMQKEEQIIVSSIISMAKQLNMKVLSEGVETQTQSDFLKTVDCDMAQGYLYSKPIPVEDFEFLMKNTYTNN
ncbi:bifunctional diguanylate cyclase/phosphodiesterase [Anaerocolumna sp. MB42-C2]|uniref:bifunctional diguanylate cyclase/phosphodiesterase n=1 Tax=Anaerocolumna sp. MB42-C2 TaxID=3070997 RepID=UPI0027E011A0|nr:EAL domain-containing protein [Anaerocolumna sp. MB42-C2]WMJ87334.1 EAL domain-containing protein [Anaerocolumna sp. MB42-C2]